MNKKDIVEALVAHYAGGNKARFGKMLGVTQQTIQSWVARNTMNIDLIYAKCININPHWLLTGEGDMLLNNNGTTRVYAPYHKQSIEGHHNSQHIGQGISPEAYQTLQAENQALQAENKELRDKLDAMTQRYADLSDKFLVLLNKI